MCSKHLCIVCIKLIMHVRVVPRGTGPVWKILNSWHEKLVLNTGLFSTLISETMTEDDIRYNILIIIGVASEQSSRISWKKGSDTVMMTRLSFMLRYEYFSSSESKKYFQLPQFYLYRYSFHSPGFERSIKGSYINHFKFPFYVIRYSYLPSVLFCRLCE